MLLSQMKKIYLLLYASDSRHLQHLKNDKFFEYSLFFTKTTKRDLDFMIVIHSNFLFAMLGYRDKDVLLPTGHDVIVNPPPGNAAHTFS